MNRSRRRAEWAEFSGRRRQLGIDEARQLIEKQLVVNSTTMRCIDISEYHRTQHISHCQGRYGDEDKMFKGKKKKTNEEKPYIHLHSYAHCNHHDVNKPSVFMHALSLTSRSPVGPHAAYTGDKDSRAGGPAGALNHVSRC